MIKYLNVSSDAGKSCRNLLAALILISAMSRKVSVFMAVVTFVTRLGFTPHLVFAMAHEADDRRLWIVYLPSGVDSQAWSALGQMPLIISEALWSLGYFDLDSFYILAVDKSRGCSQLPWRRFFV